VLDVSRLGYAGHMLTEAGITRFQEVLDGCEPGNLGGVLVIRSWLDSQVPQGLCWRGEPSLPLLLAGGCRTGRQPATEGNLTTNPATSLGRPRAPRSGHLSLPAAVGRVAQGEAPTALNGADRDHVDVIRPAARVRPACVCCCPCRRQPSWIRETRRSARKYTFRVPPATGQVTAWSLSAAYARTRSSIQSAGRRGLACREPGSSRRNVRPGSPGLGGRIGVFANAVDIALSSRGMEPLSRTRGE